MFKVFTLPEYLQLRFDGQRAQVYMSLFEFLFYIFTYVLGVYSTRVPPEKVLMNRDYKCICHYLSSSSIYLLMF